MKKLNLYNFHLTDMEIKHLEMIHQSLRDTTDTFLQMMQDDEFTFDLKSAREIFALYAMEVNRNIHQVSKVINQLEEMAETALNNDSKLTGDKYVKRLNNADLAEQYAGFEW